MAEAWLRVVIGGDRLERVGRQSGASVRLATDVASGPYAGGMDAVSMEDAVTREEARVFAERWLPAWTGNRPEYLASFYSEDAFYRDPSIPEGVHGHSAIAAYFSRLLSRFPDWVWEQTDATPMEGGFLNHWHATIPVTGHVIECDGVCTVRLASGLIERNEVFFDRTALMAALNADR